MMNKSHTFATLRIRMYQPEYTHFFIYLCHFRSFAPEERSLGYVQVVQVELPHELPILRHYQEAQVRVHVLVPGDDKVQDCVHGDHQVRGCVLVDHLVRHRVLGDAL